MSTGNTLVLKNYTALFAWFFCAFWIILSGLFLYLLARDGNQIGIVGQITIPVIATFGTAVLVSYSLNCYLTSVVFDRARRNVVVRKRGLVSGQIMASPFSEIQTLEIVETIDSDGDPYFHLDLVLAAEQRFTLQEGHHRPDLAARQQEIEQFISS